MGHIGQIIYRCSVFQLLNLCSTIWAKSCLFNVHFVWIYVLYVFLGKEEERNFLLFLLFCFQNLWYLIKSFRTQPFITCTKARYLSIYQSTGINICLPCTLFPPEFYDERVGLQIVQYFVGHGCEPVVVSVVELHIALVPHGLGVRRFVERHREPKSTKLQVRPLENAFSFTKIVFIYVSYLQNRLYLCVLSPPLQPPPVYLHVFPRLFIYLQPSFIYMS